MELNRRKVSWSLTCVHRVSYSFHPATRYMVFVTLHIIRHVILNSTRWRVKNNWWRSLVGHCWLWTRSFSLGHQVHQPVHLLWPCSQSIIGPGSSYNSPSSPLAMALQFYHHCNSGCISFLEHSMLAVVQWRISDGSTTSSRCTGTWMSAGSCGKENDVTASLWMRKAHF